MESQNGILKANDLPVSQEKRCFFEIEMEGGVGRVVHREAPGAARKVGRINLIVYPDDAPQYANKFYEACKDNSIRKTNMFHLFERQIAVALADPGIAALNVPVKLSWWQSLLGRSSLEDLPANTGILPTQITGDPTLSQRSFFPKVGSAPRKLRHDEPFVISARPGSSEILISTEAATSLDGRWIVFGRVADRESVNIVKRIKRYAAANQNKVFVASSGVVDNEAVSPRIAPSASPVTEPSTSAGNTVSSG